MLGCAGGLGVRQLKGGARVAYGVQGLCVEQLKSFAFASLAESRFDVLRCVRLCRVLASLESSRSGDKIEPGQPSIHACAACRPEEVSYCILGSADVARSVT